METNEHSLSEDIDPYADRCDLLVQGSVCVDVVLREITPERLQSLFCVYRL